MRVRVRVPCCAELCHAYACAHRQSHYEAELEVELTKLNQYVTASLIVASDDSEEEGEMDFTEAVKNFKPGFM